MREACLVWILSFLSTLSASAIRKGWVTEVPLPLSSAPAPPRLETSPTPAFNNTSTVSPGLLRSTTPGGSSSSISSSRTSSGNLSSLQDEDDYYSPYPDYPDLLLNSSEEERRVLEEALPDNSLADTDLHDHDLIDSVMYIYFGGTARQESPPRQLRPHQTTVLIVGAVIGLVAQLLTLVGTLRRVRCCDPPLVIIINTELALTLANLVFMLGVQSTSDRWHCEMVALCLHYLHLVASSWFSSNCVYLYLKLRDPGRPPRLLLHFALAWGLPVAAVYMCSLVERPGYEFRDYCWMSVERGMVLSFMAPLSLLMLVNTCLSVGGLRLTGKADEADRKALRVAASLLPLFAVSWFLGVLALENSASLVFPLLFLASHSFLNWYIFICWLPGETGYWRDSDDDDDDEEEELIYEEVVKPASSLDDQPLLLFPRDELQMDPICTISS